MHVGSFPAEKAQLVSAFDVKLTQNSGGYEMKSKPSIALSIFLTTSALVLCVFAQSGPDKFQKEMQDAVRNTLLIDNNLPSKKGIFLIRVKTEENGKISFSTVFPPGPPSGQILQFKNGKMRIEMMDKSIQEIDLKNVGYIGIEDRNEVQPYRR